MSINPQRSTILWCVFTAMMLPTAMSVAEDVVGFDQVKPILRKRCVTCHNPDELRGELDLKELAAIRAGSASGDVVVAGDPSASLLYTTLAHLEDPAMPPNSPQIPAREQDIIRRWIEGGLAERTGPKVDSDASKASTPLSPVGNEADGLVEIRA
ncbi:MAG: c-type cytochrome domain-containing protein, partial [Pirellulaceae bacterium]|nr:c-type cytochrome domain-containing protein [Pirellulaceae bacterium]